MKTPNGKFALLMHQEDESVEKLGEFEIQDNNLTVLWGDVLRELLPDGPLDKSLKFRLFSLANSGHYAVQPVHDQVDSDDPEELGERHNSGGHPHAYDWHDHDEETIEKAEHPHTSIPEGAPNKQAAGVGINTYAPIAQHYGHVIPSAGKPNLNHYDYAPHEHKIDQLIGQHGYKTYYAGGKYGKPDLVNRNYPTGHLMVYDPTPGSGGDFKDEAVTRSWRKIHELSHALTLQDINQKYGEGRRLGKLGVRTPREAKRAVEWEWLAAHKQRELGEKIGIKIPDDVFHKELNTVMHDAVHRAVHGKFTEPSSEGFFPHSHKIPLQHSLDMIDQHARDMGLHHDEAKSIHLGLQKTDWNEYSQKAHSYDDVLFPVKIRGKEFLHGDIPFHISVHVSKVPLNESKVKERLAGHEITAQHPHSLEIKPHVFVTKEGRHHHALLVTNMHESVHQANAKLRDLGVGPSYPFVPHITVTKELHDEVKEKGLTSKDLDLQVGPLEHHRGGRKIP